MSAYTDPTVGIDHPTVVPTNFSAEAADAGDGRPEDSSADEQDRSAPRGAEP
ncbi:hypothetical protein [Halorubrum halophilum]|mgnify:FL=1|uniref:hypothetical protein n=1 Tax=Halorubrum halophilum TaxID=413816 RepID=UPI00186B5057|nr:hypothetical protein [Halorubrum halophilum]